MPQNPSLSFTLKHSYSRTKLEVNNNKGAIKFYYEGQRKNDFLPKIKTFFSRIAPYCPWLLGKGFDIHSFNSFPHSSGLASSASFFSSLSLCLMSYREECLKENFSRDAFLQEASTLARLGSGSAARSIFPHAALWGKVTVSGKKYQPSDEYAIPFELGPPFETYCNSIVIVSSEVKEVSSSRGHQAMDVHPYREIRYQRAKENLANLIEAMDSGDLLKFCSIVESEALDIHGLMMSGRDGGVVMLRSGTLDIIAEIRQFRRKTGIPVCFTLDAGPNVHILYPSGNKQAVREFIEKAIGGGRNFSVIHDGIGKGPIRDES